MQIAWSPSSQCLERDINASSARQAHHGCDYVLSGRIDPMRRALL
jgi:hypothetical protein